LNTLVPLEYYSLFYFNLLLAIVLWTFIQSNLVKLVDKGNLRFKNVLGLFLVVFTIVYIGTRPISGFYFVDMRTYANYFERYAAGEQVSTDKDIYFEYFMKWCSSIMSVYDFFFLCAVLYITPMYIFCKKMLREYWFYGLLILFLSLTFWSSGVNGMRNGIATSLVLLALAYRENKILMAGIFIIATAFHKSTILILAAYLFTLYFTNTKTLIKFWFFCIILSLLFGAFWQTLFAGFGFGEDERLNEYLVAEIEDAAIELKLGFRWDFLLYSASAVFAGWYYIVKQKYQDVLYHQMFNMYLITNAFWILVIRANYSNRFAYLSWFIMGIIILYPMIKVKMFDKQHVLIGRVLIIYFSFSYLMNVILS